MELDLLGTGFERETLDLGTDDEGPVVATLVRHRTAGGSDRAVLYLHGLADYFFQRHLAAFFAGQGWDFYALDLRKHGRSLLPHQTPNLMRDVSDYFPEIDRAAALIRERDRHRTLVINAHSTGGLTAAIWAESRPSDGLILNSPFFDLNLPWALRRPVAGVVTALAPLAPRATIRPAPGDPTYVHSVHVDFGGEWDFDLAWKPAGGFPIRAGQIRAFRTAHKRIHAGLAIDVPILVGTTPSDIILSSADIARWSGSLGSDVHLLQFEGARHDLVLSPPDVRGRVLRAYGRWLEKVPGEGALRDPSRTSQGR